MSLREILQRQRINIFIVVLLSGVLFFLYQQSTKTDVKMLYQMDALTHELLVQDGLMEGDMALLVSGRMNHYTV